MHMFAVRYKIQFINYVIAQFFFLFRLLYLLWYVSWVVEYHKKFSDIWQHEEGIAQICKKLKSQDGF